MADRASGQNPKPGPDPSNGRKSHTDPSDDVLMAQVLSQDRQSSESAMSALYRRYWNDLFDYLKSQKFKDPEDLVQETFMDVFRRRAFAPGYSFKSLVFVVGRYRGLSSLRKQRPTSSMNDEPAAAKSSLTALEISEFRREFAEYNAALDFDSRELLLLHHVYEMSRSELARVLNISESQVAHRLRRLKSALEVIRDNCQRKAELRRHQVRSASRVEIRSQAIQTTKFIQGSSTDADLSTIDGAGANEASGPSQTI